MPIIGDGASLPVLGDLAFPSSDRFEIKSVSGHYSQGKGMSSVCDAEVRHHVHIYQCWSHGAMAEEESVQGIRPEIRSSNEKGLVFSEDRPRKG